MSELTESIPRLDRDFDGSRFRHTMEYTIRRPCKLAQFTGARYVFLTYGAGGRATGGASDIGQRDYEELSLDDLIVPLVAEELADLHGTSDAEPPETSEDDQQGN